MKGPGRNLYTHCTAILLMAVLAAVTTFAAMPVHPHSHDSTNCQICHFRHVIHSTLQVNLASIGLVFQVFILPSAHEQSYQDPFSDAAQNRGPPLIA